MIIFKFLIKNFIFLILISTIYIGRLSAYNNYNSEKLQLNGGFKLLSGNVTYQIGGHLEYSGIKEEYPFPISELQWPIDVSARTVGFDVLLGTNFELSGNFLKIFDSYSGKIENSDWGYYIDSYNNLHSAKIIYSESDSNLEGFCSDITLKYWFTKNDEELLQKKLVCGIGAGFLYQDYNWIAANLDQWYPINPGEEHYIKSGLVGTYSTETYMPYIALLGKLQKKDITVKSSLGFSPYTSVNDTDDHILRGILAKTDTKGYAIKSEVTINYNLTSTVFFSVQGDVLFFKTDGMEHDIVYGGEDSSIIGLSWDIEHKISSLQTGILFCAGLKF